MKNPFRTLTLADKANIAITRYRHQLLQLQLEKIDHDQYILGLKSKIEHLSKVIGTCESADLTAITEFPLEREPRRI